MESICNNIMLGGRNVVDGCMWRRGEDTRDTAKESTTPSWMMFYIYFLQSFKFELNG